MTTILEGLVKRREDLNEKRLEYQHKNSIWSALAGGAIGLAIILLCFPIAYLLLTSQPSFQGLIVYLILSAFGLMVALGVSGRALEIRSRLHDAEADIRELEFSIDLEKYEVDKTEGRAENILHLNDFQLRRYYDLNLRQNGWIFKLGFFCIILGVLVIAISLIVVFKVSGQDTAAKIVAALLGGVGSLFTNAVAAIYLRMNTAATNTLTAFHNRLVETNQYLLGNLVASRIEEKEVRTKTLATLALSLAKRIPAEEKPSKAVRGRQHGEINGQEEKGEPAQGSRVG